ncbi:unnamed protein product [Mytilus coruscus]|uniref:Uncharacterized protein n=1 Tax=Mytilus coruscus TaxID=42192 RepID=A0A6J8BJ05_MYTCO|nr:unnamed protein product [Mytilus coruscus]
MSKRKFFGSHFHSVTVHLPECLRIFNLRSIVTEQEERIFGDLRRISENTTHRQAQYICDNAMLRFNSQQAAKTDYFTIQESVIQKQAHLLAPRPNSTIPAHIVSKQPTLLQAHLERISDFLLPGNDIWWHSTDNNLIFHDGPDEPCYRNQGPQLSHFRSSSLKDENAKLKVIWQTIMTQFQENQLILPLHRLKAFDVDGNPFFVTVNTTEENDLEEEDQTATCDIDTVKAHDTIIIKPENEEKIDSKSESTEDYIPNIPIMQDQPEVPAINHERKQENTETKEKYKSYIKVLRWTVQPSNNNVQESLFIKQKKLPASCRKKTTFDLVVQLLGPSSDVDDCLSGSHLQVVWDAIGFDKSFVSRVDDRVTESLVARKDEFISWPDNQRKNVIRAGLYEKAGFPSVADVKHPELLTSTLLRKQMATLAQVLNLSEISQGILATFQGHDIRVHRQFYRPPEETMQVESSEVLTIPALPSELSDFIMGDETDGGTMISTIQNTYQEIQEKELKLWRNNIIKGVLRYYQDSTILNFKIKVIYKHEIEV